MRALSRGGFILVELLIGLVILGIFAASLVSVVRGSARIARRATDFLEADRALLSLQLLAQQDLRDALRSDLALLSPTTLALSRPVGEAAVCADSGSAVVIADSEWVGTRIPQGGRDDAWLLLDPVTEDWQRFPIDSVARGRCPDGSPGTTLDLAPHTGAAAIVRVVEPVELSAYRSGASDWFGLRPASHASVVQPFAGPLAVGATRIALFVDHLDIAVPPRGASPTTVVVPLGSPP